MKFIKKINQYFCKHEFEKIQLNGFKSVDGWLVPVTIIKCKKCGYTEEVER
jgi:hypothetical protein